MKGRKGSELVAFTLYEHEEPMKIFSFIQIISTNVTGSRSRLVCFCLLQLCYIKQVITDLLYMSSMFCVMTHLYNAMEATNSCTTRFSFSCRVSKLKEINYFEAFG